ncbi:hypothetical protein FGB62_5g515 [Gracilaria domingensis]|nr:hypothetical protein FGB62_5g515 [Gracilaria domingensis]
MAPLCRCRELAPLTFLTPYLPPRLQKRWTKRPSVNRRHARAGQARPRISPDVHRATALRKAGELHKAHDLLHNASPHVRRHVAYHRELIRTTAGLVAQSSSVEKAEQLWSAVELVLRDGRSRPDAVSFNSLLSALRLLDTERQLRERAEQHDKLDVLRLAKNVFDTMIDLNVHPDQFSMSILFNMCAFRANERYAALFEKRATVDFDFKPNVVSGTALLGAFAKSGSLEHVDRVVSILQQECIPFNERTYTTIISAQLKHGKHAQVLHYFDEAITSPSVTPNTFLFSGVLTSCLRVCDGTNGIRVFEIMEHQHVRPTEAIMNLMLELAVRSGNSCLGIKYITEWAPKYGTGCSQSHYDKIIASWKRTETNVPETIHALYTLLQHMEVKSNLKPSIATYNAAIATLTAHEKTEQARQILERMRRRGIVPDVYTYNVLLHSCGKAGNFDEALENVRIMKQNHVRPNQITYNILLDLLLRYGETEKVQSLLEEIENDTQLEMDAVGRCMQLKLYRIQGNTQAALQLHSTTQRLGQPLDSKAYSLLLSILFEFDEREKAISLFGWLLWTHRLESSMYNVMMDNIGKEENGYEYCFKLFNHMKEKGVLPDKITYSTMIRVFSKAGFLDRAFRLLGEMQDLGLAISDMYAWTSLMDGCRKNGQWQRAVELLAFMKKHSSESEHSLVPNPSTACYNAALYAAGIGGRDWKTSVYIYKSLLADKTQQPDIVTYSAMASIILCKRRKILEWHIVRQVCQALEDLLMEDTKLRNGTLRRQHPRTDVSPGLSKSVRKKLLTKMSSLKELIRSVSKR